jgi:ectoine hydroxylase-related dioxygenase (phytanoyl-CoA dioxygenase family)
MSLHDVYMIHGARANTSTQRRTGVALRYMPATSVFRRDLKPVDGKTGVAVNFSRRPLWLLKAWTAPGRTTSAWGIRRALAPQPGRRCSVRRCVTTWLPRVTLIRTS